MIHELEQRAGGGHETRDAEVRPILLAGAALALLLIFSGLLGYVLMVVLVHYRPTTKVTSPLAISGQIPPLPRIEEHPADERLQLREQEDRVLSTYGWVNKGAGIVRIPIDRAMELQLQRGFPTRKEQPKR